MKPDEAMFMAVIAERIPDRRPSPGCVHVRDIIRELHAGGKIHYKRAWCLLSKWALKDWYDYGVSLDLGWLTEAGLNQANEQAQRLEVSGRVAG